MADRRVHSYHRNPPDEDEDPADMPVFVIKGKDALAVPTLKAYFDECVDHGLMSQAAEVERAIDEVSRWQRSNIDKTKLPDHRHVPVGGS